MVTTMANIAIVSMMVIGVCAAAIVMIGTLEVLRDLRRK